MLDNAMDNPINTEKKESDMQNESVMYKIKTYEKRYVNSEDSSVEVSFQLPGRDWNELLQSPQWKALENFLNQKKSIDIQKLRTVQEDL